MAKMEEKLEALLGPVVEGIGYELADLAFVKEGQNWYLRLYVDQEGGVSLDDCEAISRAVEEVMDEKDPIEQAYFLEVSSPGLDRPLKKDRDFERFRGHLVDLKLYRAQEKRKTFQGELVKKENGQIIIREDGQERSFEEKDVAQVRLAVIL